MSTIRDRKKTE